MPPKFNSQHFKFAEGEAIPEHEEVKSLICDEPDLAMCSLWGHIPYDGEQPYLLATGIDAKTAKLLETARARHNEATQQSSSGKGFVNGFVETVYVTPPES